jgi:hypothetical protein
MAIRKSSISGTPSGNTANRPADPQVGATYNNGTLGVEEIYTASGWVAKSAPASVPTINSVSQSNSAATYVATSSASVAFSPGVGGGLPTSYTVTSSPGNLSASGESSPLIVTGLTNGTSYTFTATATNNFNTSNASLPSSTLIASTIPQSPTIGTASATGTSGELSVIFTAGQSGGKNITNYKYQLNNSGSYTAFSPAQTTSPLTINGLTDGTSYTIKLKAVNENGDSLESSASNSASPQSSVDVDYLVVAGGGGGARPDSNNPSAGGGAGGYRTSIGGSPLTIIKGVATDVVIGAGGAGATSFANGGKGSNSRFATIYSTGGGGGAREGLSGGSGGSGGGDASTSTSPGAGNEGGYTPVEGYSGGNGSGDGAGGGGGAGGAAPAATDQYTNGSGGIGSNSAASWATITSSGANGGYFAGGGGGGSYRGNNNTGTGGLGGGGDGKGQSGAGGAGINNTGGGGGGSGGPSGSWGDGGNGGSGIVIIKYPSATTATFNGLTQTTYTDSGFKYTKITGGTGTVTFS